MYLLFDKGIWIMWEGGYSPRPNLRYAQFIKTKMFVDALFSRIGGKFSPQSLSVREIFKILLEIDDKCGIIDAARVKNVLINRTTYEEEWYDD